MIIAGIPRDFKLGADSDFASLFLGNLDRLDNILEVAIEIDGVIVESTETYFDECGFPEVLFHILRVLDITRIK